VNVGACGLVTSDAAFALGQDVCLIKPKAHQGSFLNLVMHSDGMKQELQRELIGSTFNRINVAEVKALMVPLPPAAEQAAISSAVRQHVARLDSSHRAAIREIELVREYRIRLISDVVTGKLDVREASHNLPDAPEADLGERVTTAA
jgi:type I restriction enzyme S subunit